MKKHPSTTANKEVKKLIDHHHKQADHHAKQANKLMAKHEKKEKGLIGKLSKMHKGY